MNGKFSAVADIDQVRREIKIFNIFPNEYSDLVHIILCYIIFITLKGWDV
jgi:hypothetical protein